MAYPNGSGVFTQGLAADLLGRPPNPAPPGLAGALLQGLPPVTPAPGMVTEGNLPPVSAYPSGPAAQIPPDPNLIHQQRTIYGETAGIYPQLTAQADDKGVYRAENWNPDSAQQLKTARAWMAGVRLVNPKVRESVPDLSTGVERMVWGNSVDAAQAAQQLKPPSGTNHFLIRQEGGDGLQTPPSSWGNTELVRSFGPFMNTGGGDVPKGSNTYIDFYKADN